MAHLNPCAKDAVDTPHKTAFKIGQFCSLSKIRASSPARSLTCQTFEKSLRFLVTAADLPVCTKKVPLASTFLPTATPVFLLVVKVMSPSSASADVPSRPKFSFDLRNPPWTDGRGNQEEYYRKVVAWKAMHDLLPADHNSKILPQLQGVILQSQLYGRAVDLVSKVTDAQLQGDNGALYIARAIYKTDPLSALTDGFMKFQSVLNTRRGPNETFRNFESRFDAAVSRFHTSSTEDKLSPSLIAFLLLANANVEDNHRISILAAAAPQDDQADSNSDSDFSIPKYKLAYDTVATVIRSCDSVSAQVSRSNPPAHNSRSPALTTHSVNNPKKNSRKKMSRDEIRELKKKSTCKDCGEIGHWKGDAECKKSGSAHASASKDQNKPSTVTFHMVNMRCSENAPDEPLTTTAHNVNYTSPDDVFADGSPGPMVDDGAPYSGLGITELRTLSSRIMPGWNGDLEPLPDCIADRPWWQYGNGDHSSETRRILGSVYLSVRGDSGITFRIRHLVIEGSTQWVIGRNFTTNVDILNASGSCVRCPLPNGGFETLKLQNFDMHSYVNKTRFYHEDFRSVCDPTAIAICAAATRQNNSWKQLCAVIDKVHHHVCGHSNFSDIKLLLQRNGLWTDSCTEYLAQKLDSCEHCHAVRQPQKPRTVSLNNLSREFNEVVLVDHMFLDDLIVLHVMDAKTRYSTGAVVNSTSMADAIVAFDACWLSPFWAPLSLQADTAFQGNEFSSFLHDLGTELRPSPPYRHNKNALESKHRVIRDVFLRLQQASPEIDARILVTQALRICNDLYGNDVASSYELAHNRTRPVVPGPYVQIPEDVIEAHENLIAVRKLNAILRSKATIDKSIKIGDVVEVYRKQSHTKRGRWSQPTPVLAYNPSNQSITVTGPHGRTIQAALEDTRYAVNQQLDLATVIQQAIDSHSVCLDAALEQTDENPSDSSSFQSCGPQSESDDEDPTPNVPVGPPAVPAPVTPDPADVTYTPAQPSEYDPEDTESPANPTTQDSANAPVRVGQRELQSLGPAVHSEPQMRTRSSNAHEIELKPGEELSSAEQENLLLYKDRFKSKEFLRHHAQGLPSSVIENAYTAEEDSFLQNCERVHYSDVPANANVVSSHVIYKVKDLDDHSLHCKARIAPHGNKDSEKDGLRTDSSSCPSFGIRLLLFVCTILGWFLTKVDVKSAFLQSGRANRDVYVIPPRECRNRSFLWLLLVAAYGLANANAKWQVHSDDTFLSFGLHSVPFVPQLFFKREGGELVLIVAKIVDDILFGGTEKARREFQKHLESVYKLGTISHMPGQFLFFGLQITQDDHAEITIDADEKLTAIEPAAISRLRRKECDEPLTALERHQYMSINGSMGFLGQNVSPFASFFTSYLQQRNSDLKVSDLVHQINIVKKLKSLSTVSRFRRPSTGTHEISMLVFSDAGRPSDYGQLGYLAGVLIGDLKKGSVFHPISWRSHLSSRPTKSSASAETLAAGDATDDGLLLVSSLELILNTKINLTVAIDSKDLYNSLSTCRTPTDKSIRGDVSLLRYNFETRKLHKVVWLPGTVNPADVLTKLNSGLVDTVQLLLFDGYLPIDLSKSEARNTTQSLG